MKESVFNPGIALFSTPHRTSGRVSAAAVAVYLACNKEVGEHNNSVRGEGKGVERYRSGGSSEPSPLRRDAVATS